jgi:putative endonuclease
MLGVPVLLAPEGTKHPVVGMETFFVIMKEYYVYIMSNKRGSLYTGVTNDLLQRVYQHKNKLIEGFTKKYNINSLVYFESSDDVTAAIAREKQIKGLLRSKKVALIKSINPKWEDLSKDWFDLPAGS